MAGKQARDAHRAGLPKRTGLLMVVLVTFLMPTLAVAQSPMALALPAGLGVTGLVALAVVSAWGFASELGLRRDRWQLHRRYAAVDFPVFLTGVDGRIEWCNRAARGSRRRSDRGIAEALCRRIPESAALVYRIASNARQVGFACESVRIGQDDGEAILVTARAQDPNRLVWALLPPQSGARDDLSVHGHKPEPIAFPCVCRSSDGQLHPNAQWREIFGAPERVAEKLDGILPGERRRLLIEDRTGSTRLVEVHTTDAGGQRQFLFLPFPDEVPTSMATTLEVLPVALMELDPNGRTLASNALAREMLGRTVMPGTPLGTLVEPLGRPLEGLLGEVAGGGGRRREMVRLRGADPEVFLHISISAVGEGEALRLLAVLTDASELRLLEDKFAQSQKMEAVGKLAGGIAHDFNNVLTAISGHADLLLLGKDARHPDYSDLMQIRQNTLRATALVRQLLAFSRKQTLKPTLLSVPDVVADTQYLLDRLIGEKVKLVLQHGRGVGMVRADRQQLEQALMNLVVNARDAMPDGGVITITTRRRMVEPGISTQGVEVPPGSYVEICVCDEGTGIDEGHLDRIFEPFFTTKAQGEGTGLGLSTVYGIVKQSGGYIFAENRDQGGACFRILLPEAGSESPAVAATVDADMAARRDLTGRGAILLVEDEAPVRSFASRALRLRGYEVIEAASAEEAMRFLGDDSVHVDLVISDVVMPGMDGPTFATEARRHRSELKVIFVSGYAQDSFRRAAFDGEFVFLPKPFSLTELTACVKEALDDG